MKKIMIAATLLMSIQGFAQDTNENERSRKIVSTGYGVASTQYSRFNGKSAIFTGAYGGWMINHKLTLGLGGYGLVTQHNGYDAIGSPTSDNEIKMGYGGLVAEYTFLEKKRIHFSTSILLGAGAAVNAHRLSQRDEFGDDWRSDDESGFIVFQPSVSVEADITRWFRVGVGAGYRLVGSSDLIGLSDRDMSAPTANLSLKFGVF